MTPETFLAEFGHFADAPNGVQKLRELILQLAVKGKLVAKDPGDEPAANLLSKIRSERDNLLAGGSIKRAKMIPEIDPTEAAYEAPPGWVWTRLGDLCFQVTDGTHHTPKYVTTGVPFISVKNISGGRLSFADTKFITEEEHLEINKRCNPARNDILICRIGTLGKATLVDTDRPFSIFVSVGLLKYSQTCITPRFLEYVLNSALLTDQYEAIKAGGSHTNKLNLRDIPSLHIPLPPLAEQKRIVAKVDQLMALCDELEARKQQRREARVRLNNAALDALLNTTDPDDFAAHWRRIGHHFDLLYDHPETIANLRAASLQLAVQGKLVPQDPGDEPATEILKRISWDDELFESSEGKKARQLPKSNELNQPFDVPPAWVWTTCEALTKPGRKIRYGILKPGPDTPDGVPYVRITEMKSGTIDLDSLRRCDPSHEAKFRDARLIGGDIVVSKDGTIGKIAYVPPNLDGGNITQHLLRVSPSDQITGRFLGRAIQSPFCQGWMTGEVRGLALQGINVGDFRRMPIPLPPAAEQKRIVAKVDQLMALCDDLEAKLTQAREQSQKLMEAAVRHFVDQAPKPIPAASQRNKGRVGSAHRPQPNAEAKPVGTTHPTAASAQPPAPKQLPLPSLSTAGAPKRGVTPNGNIPQAILDHMRPGTAYSRADITTALGLANMDWTWAIRQLKEQRQVIQTGQPRGARYRLATQATQAGQSEGSAQRG